MNAPVKEQTSPVEHIRGYHAELREIRRDLHAHPELAFEENRTSSVVVEYLKKFGIETHTGLARTGVVGVTRIVYPADTARVPYRVGRVKVSRTKKFPADVNV